jgi:hypothetical protein
LNGCLQFYFNKMHVPFTPENTDYWLKFYQESVASHSQYQIGGELSGFRAFAPYHRGGGLGSFFKSLYRHALPILKSVGIHALSAGSKIAADLAQGRKFSETAKEHSKAAAGEFLKESASKLGQKGEGLGRRRQYKRKRSKSHTSFPRKKIRRKVAPKFQPDLFDTK